MFGIYVRHYNYNTPVGRTHITYKDKIEVLIDMIRNPT